MYYSSVSLGVLFLNRFLYVYLLQLLVCGHTRGNTLYLIRTAKLSPLRRPDPRATGDKCIEKGYSQYANPRRFMLG